MADREFRYDVELRTLRGKPRRFRYFAVERPVHGSKPIRYHSDWFIAEAIKHPASASAFGTIVGTEVPDLMRNDMRDAVADNEGWDRPTRSQAMDRTRMLRRELVRWLLVLDQPPALRAVRDDDTVLSEHQIESGSHPTFKALLAISERADEAR